MNPFPASAMFLRRRSVWEAADSGILLWRASFAYFIPFFVLPVVIAACAVHVFFAHSTFLLFFVFWWLKPFFDRLVLHVVSVKFFAGGGASPLRFKEIFRGLGQMRRGLFGDLLWRRFSPQRAAHMPIRVLERIGGGHFHARKKALASGGLGFCSFLSFMGLALEAFLLASKIVFAIVMMRTFFPFALDLFDNPDLAQALIFAAFCVNYILVGSLYVCMAFALYINSRVEVEGWDLQLLFQKFASHSAASGRPAAGAGRGAIMALLVCLFLALPQPAYAQTQPELQPDLKTELETELKAPIDDPQLSGMESLPFPDYQSLRDLETILASPDFGGSRDRWRIRLRERERADRQPLPPIPWLEGIREIMGYVLRGIAILASAGLIIFALYWCWKNRRKGASLFRAGGKQYAPLLFSPESPQSLFARAEAFSSRGNAREAWAACLAGCIRAFSQCRSLSFPANATEYSCLRLVRQALPAEAPGFDVLVRSWILFAYGGKTPGEGAFEQALSYGRSLLANPRSRDEP